MAPAAIWDDVVFDHTGAAALGARFRTTADLLDVQRTHRSAEAIAARQAWRGRFADEFDARMVVCRDDAVRLASAMRAAADGLDRLAHDARREQRRREAARAHERREAERSLVARAGDTLHDLVFGDDLPPVPPPADPPRYRDPGAGLVAACRRDT